MSENGSPEGKKQKMSVRTTVNTGFLILLFVFFFTSMANTHLVRPALSFWQPLFTLLFGDISGNTFGFVPRFWLLVVFSIFATLISAFLVGVTVNSRWFTIRGLLFRKVPLLKHFFSFAQRGASAYRNLKRIRPVYLRVKIGEFELLLIAYVTKERLIYVDGVWTSYCVIFRPHTPTAVTGDTFLVPKKYVKEGGVIDVSGTTLMEDVVSAGIFGPAEEIKEEP